jgi:hypothetical protein
MEWRFGGYVLLLSCSKRLETGVWPVEIVVNMEVILRSSEGTSTVPLALEPETVSTRTLDPAMRAHAFTVLDDVGLRCVEAAESEGFLEDEIGDLQLAGIAISVKARFEEPRDVTRTVTSGFSVKCQNDCELIRRRE